MHEKVVLSDDDFSESEDNPLIEEVSLTPYRYRSSRQSSSLATMRHRIIAIVFVFLVLLSIHILIFNNVKIYNRREVSGWSQNTSRDTVDYVLPTQNTTLIEPPQLCREAEPTFLLIVVCSAANNFEARQSIRESWGNMTEFNYNQFEKLHGAHNGSFLNINSKHWRKYVENSSNASNSNYPSIRVRVAFLLGVSSNDVSEEQQYQINYEHDFYGDIIQENFVDSYNNLTLKTILMLKWANNNCVNKVKYIMKCDDDSFVNVPNLVHVLLGGTLPVYKATVSFYDKLSVNARSARNRLTENKFLLMGYKFCSAKPISDVTSKWYAPNYMFSGEFYPDYLSGTAYVMSFEAAQRLYKGSLVTPLFHLEDVYLTGFVSEKIKLKRQHHPLFYYLSVKDQCSLRGMLTQHHLSPMSIEMAYSFVNNATKKCAVPEKNFLTTKLKLTPRKRCQ